MHSFASAHNLLTRRVAWIEGTRRFAGHTVCTGQRSQSELLSTEIQSQERPSAHMCPLLFLSWLTGISTHLLVGLSLRSLFYVWKLQPKLWTFRKFYRACKDCSLHCTQVGQADCLAVITVIRDFVITNGHSSQNRRIKRMVGNGKLGKPKIWPGLVAIIGCPAIRRLLDEPERVVDLILLKKSPVWIDAIDCNAMMTAMIFKIFYQSRSGRCFSLHRSKCVPNFKAIFASKSHNRCNLCDENHKIWCDPNIVNYHRPSGVAKIKVDLRFGRSHSPCIRQSSILRFVNRAWSFHSDYYDCYSNWSNQFMANKLDDKFSSFENSSAKERPVNTWMASDTDDQKLWISI